MKNIIAAAVFTTLLVSANCLAQSETEIPIEVSIENVKSSKGNIVVSIFKNEKSFKAEAPDLERSFSKKEVKKGKFSAVLKLPPGTYGIAILDDENADRKMNYNALGIPTEGYGFSDFYHSGFSKPKFGNFSFQLFKGKKVLKAIKLRYF